MFESDDFDQVCIDVLLISIVKDNSFVISLTDKYNET